VRYPRGEGFGVPLDPEVKPIPIGEAELLRDGDDLALIAYGTLAHPALEAANELGADGVSVAVLNARFAKPLDRELLHSLAASHDLLVTVEENVLSGGFGSAVVEHLADRDQLGGARVLRVGLPDAYVTHGKPALLRDEVGLTPEAVAERVAQAVLEPSLA
jgi:1-deoxy-D-xylulose-5-phosphate synthase